MKIRYITICFGILVALISCGQIDPNKQIDEGTFKNDVYSSQELGWTIEIPSNWDIISRAQTDAYEEKGREAFEKTLEGDIDFSDLKNLIGFQKNKFNIFQSTSEPITLEDQEQWEENNAGLKELIYITYENEGIKVDSTETTLEKVDGLNFHTYEFTIYSPNGDVILNQLLYSRLINGLDFGVNINYNNEADKKEMLNSWLNSTFRKQKKPQKKHK